MEVECRMMSIVYCTDLLRGEESQCDEDRGGELQEGGERLAAADEELAAETGPHLPAQPDHGYPRQQICK